MSNVDVEASVHCVSLKEAITVGVEHSFFCCYLKRPVTLILVRVHDS